VNTPLTPAVADLATIYTRELGRKRAAELTAVAGIEAARSLTELGALQDREHPLRGAEQMCWSMWEALAEERPQLYFPNGHKLRHRNLEAYAFAYARAREHYALMPLSLSEREASTLRRARRALYLITELPRLRRAVRTWMYTQKSLALRHHNDFPTSNGAIACAFNDPVLGHHILLSGDYVAYCRLPSAPAHRLLEVLLHEEIHIAVYARVNATMAQWEKVEISRSWNWQGLQEPVAILSELYVRYLLRKGTPPTLAQLRALTHKHPDGAKARALLELAPQSANSEDVIRLAVEAAVIASTPYTDTDLAHTLSTLFAIPERDHTQWLHDFTTDITPAKR
jgi:hypothetical protein